VRVTVRGVFTVPVWIWTVPETLPCGMLSVALGNAEVSEDVSPTGIPPAGAGDVRYTVTTATPPLEMVGNGLTVTELMVEAPVLIPRSAVALRVKDAPVGEYFALRVDAILTSPSKSESNHYEMLLIVALDGSRHCLQAQ